MSERIRDWLNPLDVYCGYVNRKYNGKICKNVLKLIVHNCNDILIEVIELTFNCNKNEYKLRYISARDGVRVVEFSTYLYRGYEETYLKNIEDLYIKCVYIEEEFYGNNYFNNKLFERT